MLEFELENCSSWDYLSKSDKPVLIYGMGNGADKIIDILNQKNIEICGVMASDDFVRGQTFRGFTVKKLSDFSGDFIVVPAFGSSLPDVMNHIIDISRVYDMIIPTVPVFGGGIYDDDFIEKNADKLNKVYSLLSEKSKSIYADCINFFYSGKIKYLLESQTEKREIFDEFLCLDGSGVFVDLGAYRGDTIEEYLSYTKGAYNEIIALEPDRKTFKKLKEKFGQSDNIDLHNKAVSNKSGIIKFNCEGSRNSSISEIGVEIECVTIDELCFGKNIEYIKMDVEGSEMDALSGAENTIKRCKPKLNTALYHRLNDLFEIPLKIYELNPDYEFEIRHHPYIPCWDFNLYCR